MRMLTAKAVLGMYGATVSAWTAPGSREVNMGYCEFGKAPIGVDTYRVDFPIITTAQLVAELDRNWFLEPTDKIVENF
jgi:hypothetical protein